MRDEPELRRLLWFLLGGTRGGLNRARIIARLKAKPSNQNQLARDLRMEYKAVQHHIRVLTKSALVVATGEKYGVVYSLSPWLEGHMDVFDEVCRRLSFGAGDSGLA